MFEYFILGAVQGLVEWLPLSSEGMVFLVKSIFFDNGESAIKVLHLSLFLHLGTFFAALIYFRKEVLLIFKTIVNYRQANDNDKKLFLFLTVTTLISGSLGYFLSKAFESASSGFENFGKFITGFVAITLFVTGVLIIKSKKELNRLRKEGDLSVKDGVFLGLVQGLAVLPGLSRSGLTVSTLLFRKFDDVSAMRLSFLMSMPIIFLGNVVLNFDKDFLSWSALIGVLTAFAVGLLTINIFFSLIKKINFGYFALLFAVLMGVSILVK